METAGTWLSILPPLVAILLALALRQVIPALFAGIWLGARAIHGFSLEGAWIGLLESFEKYTLQSLGTALLYLVLRLDGKRPVAVAE